MLSCVASFGFLSPAGCRRVLALLSACGAEHRRIFRMEDVFALPSRSLVVASGSVPSFLFPSCLAHGVTLEVR